MKVAEVPGKIGSQALLSLILRTVRTGVALQLMTMLEFRGQIHRRCNEPPCRAKPSRTRRTSRISGPDEVYASRMPQLEPFVRDIRDLSLGFQQCCSQDMWTNLSYVSDFVNFERIEDLATIISDTTALSLLS
ncbi:hypothetical protein KM043_012980 [Ampulex compressa]|nr:hypothetical protein KM043_012980 [Ampulex compressa]